jgi:hypothetical protein
MSPCQIILRGDTKVSCAAPESESSMGTAGLSPSCLVRHGPFMRLKAAHQRFYLFAHAKIYHLNVVAELDQFSCVLCPGKVWVSGFYTFALRSLHQIFHWH